MPQDEQLRPAGAVAAVIPAGGRSRRMGAVKALLPFGGRPMIARVVEAVARAGAVSDIVVVTGHVVEEISAALAGLPCRLVHNPAHATGEMISSVRAGVASLPADVSAFFVVLADQPMVRPESLIAMTDALRRSGAPVVLPRHAGPRGHPVLFDGRCREQVLALPPDATLKDLVRGHGDRCLELDLTDPAVVTDVDTPEDYQRALAEWERQAGRE